MTHSSFYIYITISYYLLLSISYHASTILHLLLRRIIPPPGWVDWRTLYSDNPRMTSLCTVVQMTGWVHSQRGILAQSRDTLEYEQDALQAALLAGRDADLQKFRPWCPPVVPPCTKPKPHSTSLFIHWRWNPPNRRAWTPTHRSWLTVSGAPTMRLKMLAKRSPLMKSISVPSRPISCRRWLTSVA